MPVVGGVPLGMMEVSIHPNQGGRSAVVVTVEPVLEYRKACVVGWGVVHRHHPQFGELAGG